MNWWKKVKKKAVLLCDLYTFGTNAPSREIHNRNSAFHLSDIIHQYIKHNTRFKQLYSVFFYFFFEISCQKYSFQTLNKHDKWNKLVNSSLFGIVSIPLWITQIQLSVSLSGMKLTWLWFFSGSPDDNVLMFLFVKRTALPHSVRKWSLLVSKVIHINISALWSCQWEEYVIRGPSLPELLQ